MSRYGMSAKERMSMFEKKDDSSTKTGNGPKKIGKLNSPFNKEKKEVEKVQLKKTPKKTEPKKEPLKKEEKASEEKKSTEKLLETKVEEKKPEPTKVEEKKPEPKKVEPKKSEPKKVEEKKPEPKKVEEKKTEPKKIEEKKPEVKKVEPKKPEPKKVEEKKPEAKKVEPKKPEVKKVEEKKPELKKVEEKKPEPKKVEEKKPEPKKVEEKKPEPKKFEVKKPEPKKVEEKKPEPKKVEEKKPEPKKFEVKKPEPKKVEEKKPEPKKVEEKKPEPKKVEEKKPEPKRVDEKKPEPKKVEEKKPELKKVDEKKPEPQKVVEKKPEPKKVEEKKPELKKVDEKKPEPQKVEEKKPEPKKVEEKKPEPKKVEVKKPEQMKVDERKPEAQTFKLKTPMPKEAENKKPEQSKVAPAMNQAKQQPPKTQIEPKKTELAKKPEPTNSKVTNQPAVDEFDLDSELEANIDLMSDIELQSPTSIPAGPVLGVKKDATQSQKMDNKTVEPPKDKPAPQQAKAASAGQVVIDNIPAKDLQLKAMHEAVPKSTLPDSGMKVEAIPTSDVELKAAPCKTASTESQSFSQTQASPRDNGVTAAAAASAAAAAAATAAALAQKATAAALAQKAVLVVAKENAQPEAEDTEVSQIMDAAVQQETIPAQTEEVAITKPVVDPMPRQEFKPLPDEFYNSIFYFSGMGTVIGSALAEGVYVSENTARISLDNEEVQSMKHDKQKDEAHKEAVISTARVQAEDIATELKHLQHLLDSLPTFLDSGVDTQPLIRPSDKPLRGSRLPPPLIIAGNRRVVQTDPGKIVLGKGAPEEAPPWVRQQPTQNDVPTWNQQLQDGMAIMGQQAKPGHPGVHGQPFVPSQWRNQKAQPVPATAPVQMPPPKIEPPTPPKEKRLIAPEPSKPIQEAPKVENVSDVSTQSKLEPNINTTDTGQVDKLIPVVPVVPVETAPVPPPQTAHIPPPPAPVLTPTPPAAHISPAPAPTVHVVAPHPSPPAPPAPVMAHHPSPPAPPVHVMAPHPSPPPPPVHVMAPPPPPIPSQISPRQLPPPVQTGFGVKPPPGGVAILPGMVPPPAPSFKPVASLSPRAHAPSSEPILNGGHAANVSFPAVRRSPISDNVQFANHVPSAGREEMDSGRLGDIGRLAPKENQPVQGPVRPFGVHTGEVQTSSQPWQDRYGKRVVADVPQPKPFSGNVSSTGVKTWQLSRLRALEAQGYDIHQPQDYDTYAHCKNTSQSNDDNSSLAPFLVSNKTKKADFMKLSHQTRGGSEPKLHEKPVGPKEHTPINSGAFMPKMAVPMFKPKSQASTNTVGFKPVNVAPMFKPKSNSISALTHRPVAVAVTNAMARGFNPGGGSPAYTLPYCDL